MPAIKTEAFEMDRRRLMKLAGAMGVGTVFVSPQELFAAGECDKIFIDNGKITADQAGATLQFWIDGLHYGARTDLKSRANITLFMDLTQSASSYVEAVVLMDANKRTMGARYFDSSTKMSTGHVPYVRFDNIELNHESDYHVVYTVKNNTSSKLYTAKISKPVTSALKETWLPQKMRDDFKTFLKGNTANPTPGLFSSQFQFYTQNGLENHTARGRVKELGSNGDFKINIDFMHGDAGADHYMRYFIAMDPVGRLLGFYKRTGEADASRTVASTQPNPAAGGKAIDVMRITAEQKAEYGIPDLQVANINDCPYIQFFTEDSYDALARNIIRFR